MTWELNLMEVLQHDIMIYGKSEKKHDRSLTDTSRKLYQSGNMMCEFRVDRIKLFGHIFSKDRTSPDPDNFQEFKEANKPKKPV